jgi:hypothetical protein
MAVNEHSTRKAGTPHDRHPGGRPLEPRLRAEAAKHFRQHLRNGVIALGSALADLASIKSGRDRKWIYNAMSTKRPLLVSTAEELSDRLRVLTKRSGRSIAKGKNAAVAPPVDVLRRIARAVDPLSLRRQSVSRIAPDIFMLPEQVFSLLLDLDRIVAKIPSVGKLLRNRIQKKLVNYFLNAASTGKGFNHIAHDLQDYRWRISEGHIDRRPRFGVPTLREIGRLRNMLEFVAKEEWGKFFKRAFA